MKHIRNDNEEEHRQKGKVSFPGFPYAMITNRYGH